MGGNSAGSSVSEWRPVGRSLHAFAIPRITRWSDIAALQEKAKETATEQPVSYSFKDVGAGPRCAKRYAAGGTQPPPEPGSKSENGTI